MRSSSEQRIEGLLFVEAVFLECGECLLPGKAHLHKSFDLALVDLRRCEFLHPLLSVLVELVPILLVFGGHHCVLGVVGLGHAQQSLQGEEGSADGEGGRPLVLEDVEADGPGLGGDVGVPDLGLELHLGGFVGVLGGEDDVDLEEAALVGGVVGPLDVPLPVAEVPVEQTHLHRRLLALTTPTRTVLANS